MELYKVWEIIKSADPTEAAREAAGVSNNEIERFRRTANDQASGFGGLAALASHILRTLRDHGGRYDSERHLRSLLQSDGVAFTVSDIAPA